MAKRTFKGHPITASKDARKIIGLSLPIPLATEVKVEAARRQIPLNMLFIEMWDIYKTHKRPR